MIYICAIPVLAVSILLYLVSKQWELKLLAKVSKILIILSIVFFIITYASYLGYNIPFISDFCNNLIK